MRRLLPNTIFAQLAWLIVVSALLVNLIGLLRIAFDQEGLRYHPTENTGRLAALVELLDGASPTEREVLLAKFRQSHPDFSVCSTTAPFSASSAKAESDLGQVLGPAFEVLKLDGGGVRGAQSYLIRLRDGLVLKAYEPPTSGWPVVGQRLLPWLFAAFALIALALWSGWKIAGPLQKMTRAAEQFRPEADYTPLPEAGPYEVRALASAFNRMQDRIRELLAEKNSALAAVSHDLRTPITRMRLRAEFMSDREERERTVHDLDVMDRLTQSALNYLKNGDGGGEREKTDLASLVHTVADRFLDEGKEVRVEIESHPSAHIHGLDLERALGNLIENALKYASSPVMRLSDQDGAAVIEVQDEGSGIPLAVRDEMMRPFTRGDRARSMDQMDGFGMGLAIAREAVIRQGGTFELLDAVPAGLLVRMVLLPSRGA